MVSLIISRVIILLFGTLYPAYASYKAVKTKNVKEYVKWMMYWIVFAFFTCIETVCDIFVSWIPFYYEMKIIFVLWLLSPATKGSSILYRKFVHPQLTKREKEIDSYIAKASDQGYTALITLGSKGLNYATNIVLNTAMKGQTKIADHLRKSYSLNDLSQDDSQRFIRQESDVSELDDETDNRLIEESYQSEMQEKDLDEGDERGVRKRRTLRAKDTGDLPPVDEEEDAETTGRQKNKKAYSHKEKLKLGKSVGWSDTPPSSPALRRSLSSSTPPSSPIPSRSLPSTPAPIVPGYTPFSKYGRSTSWEASPTASPKPTSSWRTRTSYSSSAPQGGK